MVSRDDIREMLYRKLYGSEGVDERVVSLVQRAIVFELLLDGLDVIVHDTCLPDSYVVEWSRFAKSANASFNVIDMRDVKLEVCLERNALRGGTEYFVPQEEIVRMYREHIEPLNL